MKELLFKRKKKFILYVIACFFPAIGNLLSDFSFALILGSIEVGEMSYFIKIFVVTVIMAITGVVLFIISRFMRIGYMRDTILDVRVLAFDKIMKNTYENFSKKSKDLYLSNLINDINIFEQHFFHKLLNVIFRGGLYLFSLIILMFIDFKFALGIFVVSIIVFFISKKFEKKTVKLQEEVSENNENFTVNISNTLNGIEILKLNRVEDKFLYNSLKAVDKVELKKFHYTVFTEGQRSMTRFITNFAFIGILIYVLNLAFHGASITRITLMIQIANSCVWPISMVLPLFNELKASVTIFEKITKGYESTTVLVSGDKKFSFETAIEAKDLKFSYEGKEVLRGTSFKIKKGGKYLLKGASGAGKSTLIKLLSKIYDNYEGSITVDDVDLKEVSESSYNEHIAFIYQDIFLFEDTIKNNITLYKNLPEEQITTAAKRAGLKEFIESRPEGLDEMLMENGKNLSGGQRQRISIARATIKDASILFVDEGTSGLNEELGRAVENTILSLDSTVIAISHRYYEGITEKYDYVLELKNGRIKQYDCSDYFEGVAM